MAKLKQKSEHQRITKLESEIPALEMEIKRIAAFSTSRFGIGLVPLLQGLPELAAIDVPKVYRKRKTYGSGGKQVAQEEWKDMDAAESKTEGKCIVYTDEEGNEDEPNPTVTFTHNDGTSQTWKILPTPGEGEELGEGETTKITICYDSEGNPTQVYIH